MKADPDAGWMVATTGMAHYFKHRGVWRAVCGFLATNGTRTRLEHEPRCIRCGNVLKRRAASGGATGERKSGRGE